MSETLPQREPGPVAIQKGIESLLAGLNERDRGRHWRIVSPPNGLEGAGAVGTGNVDSAGVVRPDHEHAIGDGGAAGASADEDVPDHPAEEVA